MPYVDLAGLSRYASRQKERLERDCALLRDMQWTRSEKAGAVSLWPAGGTPLKPVVDFLFSETPPAEGDKSPSNPSTISGVESIQVTQTNKNLASQPYHTPTSVRHGVTWTVNADGSVTANGTASANSVFYVCGINTTNLRLPVGTKCFLSGCPSGGSYSSYFMRCSTGSGSTYVSANDLGSGAVFTVSDSNSTVGVMIQITEGFTANNLVFYPQLELGESKTEWEPFTRIRVTLPLNGTYYGGTLDVATGVMTVTYASMALNENTYLSTQIFEELADVYVVGFYPNPVRLRPMSSASQAGCSILPIQIGTGAKNLQCIYLADNALAVRIQIAKTELGLGDGATGSDVRTAVHSWLGSHPGVLVYPILEPTTTVQLDPVSISALAQPDKYTPRLNTVYTDAQAVQVGYVKSPIRDEYELTQAITAQGGNV